MLVVIILYILDDTIKNPDDIEKYLGVSVLGAIPLKSEDTFSGDYGYGKQEKTKKQKVKESKKKKAVSVQDKE